MAPDNFNGRPTSDLPSIPDEQAPLARESRASSLAGLSGLAEETESRLDLRRILSSLWRYKWMVIVVTVLGTGGAFAVANYLPEQYTTQATLWVEETDRQQAARGPIQSGNLLEAYGWVDLLQSFVVLDSVVLENRLYLGAQERNSALWQSFRLKEQFRAGGYRLAVDPSGESYRIETGEGVPLVEGSVGDSIGPDLGFIWTPPDSALTGGLVEEFNVRVPREVAVSLRNRLEVQFNPAGHFLHVSLSGQDPEHIASVLNAVSERLVQVAADLKRAKLAELSEILQDQLVYAQRNLEDAERSLEDFRVGTITLPSDRGAPVSAGLEYTRDPVFQNYFALKVEADQLRRDREAILRIMDEWEETGDVPVISLEVIESVQQSSEMSQALTDLTDMRAELRSALLRYTEEHPEVERLRRDIRQQEEEVIPRMINTVLADLGAREREINQLIGSAGGELREIPPRAIEEARLRRSVTIAENLYTSLQQRYEEARLATASSIPDLRVLSPAIVPQSPSSNQKPRILLLGLVGSLGLGFLLALVRDRLDPRIRYPEQVTDGLGLPILGGIPEMKRNKPEQARQVREAMRSLRMNLTHAHGSAGPILVTISSPGPADGKSFVTSNLALSFAELGRRTLVVDGDVRRGTLHHILDTERKPGLTDMLAGHAWDREVVRSTAYENLDILPSGTRSQAAPELLASAEARELLLGFRSEYDVILVDTPPLGAGVDPFVLSTISGNLLLVVRTGGTDRELAEAKLDLLDRLPVRLLGVVLNGVPKERSYRYYSYTAGYEATNEEQGKELAPAQLKEVVQK